jgi:hypothetical protein
MMGLFYLHNSALVTGPRRPHILPMLTLVLLSTVAAAATPGPLPLIQDDFPRARAEAERRGLPLFVDVWAPW